MAELVDAYVSGAYASNGVRVRLPLPARSSSQAGFIRLWGLFIWRNGAAASKPERAAGNGRCVGARVVLHGCFAALDMATSLAVCGIKRQNPFRFVKPKGILCRGAVAKTDQKNFKGSG
jgi:hypothetical protein